MGTGNLELTRGGCHHHGFSSAGYTQWVLNKYLLDVSWMDGYIDNGLTNGWTGGYMDDF